MLGVMLTMKKAHDEDIQAKSNAAHFEDQNGFFDD